MVNLTYNTKLVFSNQNDEKNLLDMLAAHRAAVNSCSEIKFNKNINNVLNNLHTAFYNQFRKSNPNIPAQVVIRAINECLSNYRTVKSNKHKIEKPIKKRSFSMRLDKRCYSHKDGVFSIISIDKRIKCKLQSFPKLEEFLGKYSFCDPLLFVRNNKVFMSLTFEVPMELPKQPTLALGVDLGCRCFAATSENNIYQDKKFNGEKRKLRFLKRNLRSKLDQLNSKSAQKHLRNLKRKERNKNKNFCYHLANKILNDTKADLIVLENLKSLKVKKHKFQNKNRISQVPMFLLKTILTYKAHLLRKQVITVCPSYTSQIDHRTGKKDGIRRGSRYYGKDGKIMHADVNAACNIAIRSNHPVSCGFAATYGQAAVNQPIVGEIISPASLRL